MIAALILAAGTSRRLGQPKALLTLDGETLLARTVRMCRAADTTPIVLFGAQVWADQIDGAQWIQVPDPTAGMGATIAAGARAVPAQATHCLITPVDLPTLDTAHLRALVHASNPVSASVLPNERLGSPACFTAACLPELQTLQGDTGARHLLRGGRWPVVPVQPAQPLIDIDTPADWSHFLQSDAPNMEMPCG
jgi:molybdenum cofactor cytidylyltransferase